jgi:hypothetical protein
MADKEIPPLPKRRPDHNTVMTGAEVGRALEIMGVSPSQFSLVTGKPLMRVTSQIDQDEQEDLPLFYDLALYALYHFPELRTLKGPIPLPFEEWGIDAASRVRRRNATLTGAEVGNLLQIMDVSRGQFSRLTGAKQDRLRKQIRQDVSDLPLFYELVLYVLHHRPELRKLGGPIPLPFEEWGMDIKNEYDVHTED